MMFRKSLHITTEENSPKEPYSSVVALQQTITEDVVSEPTNVRALISRFEALGSASKVTFELSASSPKKTSELSPPVAITHICRDARDDVIARLRALPPVRLPISRTGSSGLSCKALIPYQSLKSQNQARSQLGHSRHRFQQKVPTSRLRSFTRTLAAQNAELCAFRDRLLAMSFERNLLVEKSDSCARHL